MDKPRYRVPAGRNSLPVPAYPRSAEQAIRPDAKFFAGDRNLLLTSWNPVLREGYQDVQESWEKAAARSVEAVQNSGFLRKVVETEVGAVVGSGLRFASRPDVDAMGITQEQADKWALDLESGFRAWANNPLACDAAGKMRFGKMQQAAYASYKCYGEILALLPFIDRAGSLIKTKVALLPPSRLSQETDTFLGYTQGVKTDDWGFPISYKLKRRDKMFTTTDYELAARDLDGRPNVVHVFDADIGTTRGISPMAPILKVVRQHDQYADANLTSALLQTIFAATLKTTVQGVDGFAGLMTGADGDAGVLDLEKLLSAKKEWRDGANIDLTQHGRIAQLFPNEELDFKEAKTPGQNYDHFVGWLMREIAAGCGVTYESATGDYRGATYSSIRMAGAEAWQNVVRRRENVVIPFCDAAKEAYADEAVGRGQLKFPGGYFAYLAVRDAALKGTWSGPAQPQADEFKSARAAQVKKETGNTSLAELADADGVDWDDRMRQQAKENDLARKLNLPLPWAMTDILQSDKGQELELNPPDPPAANPAGKQPVAQEPDPTDAELEKELAEEP